jgi:SAM-dependent methyltransferase
VKAKGADYYNRIYEGTDSVSRSLTAEVAKHVSGQSVLDLGCGIGLLASLTEGRYLGVDFSSVALEKARKLHRRAGAGFLLVDLRHFHLSPLATFDTVVLQEVLEHLDDPSLAVGIAYSKANRRIIATVPQNIPDPAHVKSYWTEEDIHHLLGNGAQVEPCGWYWLAIKDM